MKQNILINENLLWTFRARTSFFLFPDWFALICRIVKNEASERSTHPSVRQIKKKYEYILLFHFHQPVHSGLPAWRKVVSWSLWRTLRSYIPVFGKGDEKLHFDISQRSHRTLSGLLCVILCDQQTAAACTLRLSVGNGDKSSQQFAFKMIMALFWSVVHATDRGRWVSDREPVCFLLCCAVNLWRVWSGWFRHYFYV